MMGIGPRRAEGVRESDSSNYRRRPNMSLRQTKRGLSDLRPSPKRSVIRSVPHGQILLPSLAPAPKSAINDESGTQGQPPRFPTSARPRRSGRWRRHLVRRCKHRCRCPEMRERLGSLAAESGTTINQALSQRQPGSRPRSPETIRVTRWPRTHTDSRHFRDSLAGHRKPPSARIFSTPSRIRTGDLLRERQAS